MFESINIQFAQLPYFMGASVFFLLMIRLLLLNTDPQTKKANYYLIALFGLFCLFETDEFFSLIIDNYALPEFLDILMYCAHLLLGPLCYLYTANMLKPEYSALNNLKHVIPFAVMLLLAVAFKSLLSEQEAEKTLLIVFIFLYICTLLPYVVAALRKLNQYLGTSKSLLSDLENHNLNWARFWLFFMLFLAVYVVINPLLKLSGVVEDHPFEIHYFLAVAGLILLVWPNSASQKAIPSFAAFNPKDGAVAEVSVDSYEPIFNEVKSLLERESLFLNNGLTLNDISESAGYSIEDISKCINKVGGLCFYDFVNNYRIEEAKRMLMKFRSRSILDIAMDAGFSSKSAFYTAFKKRVGLTPSQYKSSELHK